jgi:O-antigen biosynthesis protein WbqV
MAVQLVKLAADVLIAVVAFLCALAIAFGWRLEEIVASQSGLALLGAGVVYGLFALGSALLLQTSRAAWRFVSLADALACMRAALLTACCLLASLFVLNRAADLPRLTFVLAAMFQAAGMGGARLAVRMLYEQRMLSVIWPDSRAVRRKRSGRPMIVIADPARFDAWARRAGADRDPHLYPAMLISTAPGLSGHRIRGVDVIGHVSALDSLLERVAQLGEDAPRTILVLDQPIEAGLTAERFASLTQQGYALLRAPAITELTEAEARRPELRRLDVEDLLSRPPVALDLEDLRILVQGKRVLVTGAGGSIGSEICRQTAALGCARLALLDFSESALAAIDADVAAKHPSLERAAILCDVRDRARVDLCMGQERPDLVFHAAALKHVPVVERHPCEGVLTNVIGTRNVGEAARACGVDIVTIVSTDKAVDPSNVMGATKRLAEWIARSLDRAGPTRFAVVRFGNVLGSNGSVAPLFREQILRGGPVKVTHPDVERFFMTIREAVQLVLHATALAAERPRDRSVIYVLEMGRPVRIVDLAHQMIKAHGKVPGRDIAVEFIGLRPGEKLTESLIDAGEVAQSSPSKGILEVAAIGPDADVAAGLLDEFERVARAGDDVSLRQLLTAKLVERLKPIEERPREAI